MYSTTTLWVGRFPQNNLSRKGGFRASFFLIISSRDGITIPKKLLQYFFSYNIFVCVCCNGSIITIISIYQFGHKETIVKLFAKNADPNPQSGHITVILDGKPYFINAQNPMFLKAFEAYKAEDWDTYVSCVNPELRLKSLYASYEGIEVKDGNLYVFGEPVHSTLATRVLSFLEHGLNCVHLFKFILKLNLNPSKRAVDELYTFLDHENLPITDNGNFIAYKAVRSDYYDKYSGTFLNTVGNVLEMPRNKVDDDKNIGCSHGLHAGTIEYAKNYMDRDGHLVLVEINPADVVSIPTDCNFQKLRTCKYKVVDEYEIDLSDPVYASRFQTENDDDVDIWNDKEEEDLCTGCNSEYNSWCTDCEQCGKCCNCDDESDDEPESVIYEGHPDAPKIEIQLELNLDNKMKEDDWKARRFDYLKMLNLLYSNRRPAVANALRNFYKSISHQHLINPEFNVLLNFTSDEDAHKIYLEYTSH